MGPKEGGPAKGDAYYAALAPPGGEFPAGDGPLGQGPIEAAEQERAGELFCDLFGVRTLGGQTLKAMRKMRLLFEFNDPFGVGALP